MNIIFFGSSKYSTIDEKALLDAFGLSLVVTTPDQQDTKTKQAFPNPVKKLALQNNIPYFAADKLTSEVYAKIAAYQPDFLVVADFRLILPRKLLRLPKKAALNVHHSLLPKFRGPSPVPFTILAGEKTTGVSIILMGEKVDAGDVLAQEKYELAPTDTTDSVLTKLNELGGNLAVRVIRDFATYNKNRKVQDESQATYTQYMQRSDGYIDLSKIDSLSPFEIRNLKLEIARKVRAYYPWPGVWTLFKIRNKEVRIKLLPNSPVIARSETTKQSQKNQTAALTSFARNDEDRILIQMEGKKPMGYKDFMNGYEEGKELLEKLGLM